MWQTQSNRCRRRQEPSAASDGRRSLRQLRVLHNLSQSLELCCVYCITDYTAFYKSIISTSSISDAQSGNPSDGYSSCSLVVSIFTTKMHKHFMSFILTDGFNMSWVSEQLCYPRTTQIRLHLSPTPVYTLRKMS